MTRRQWQLLNVLAHGPASVEQLDRAVAPFLAQDAQESSADHLSELIESGWVDATPTGYEITDRGRVAFDRLAAVVNANREIATAGVSADEYDAMLATLEKIARNLGWSDEA